MIRECKVRVQAVPAFISTLPPGTGHAVGHRRHMPVEDTARGSCCSFVIDSELIYPKDYLWGEGRALAIGGLDDGFVDPTLAHVRTPHSDVGGSRTSFRGGTPYINITISIRLATHISIYIVVDFSVLVLNVIQTYQPKRCESCTGGKCVLS